MSLPRIGVKPPLAALLLGLLLAAGCGGGQQSSGEETRGNAPQTAAGETTVGAEDLPDQLFLQGEIPQPELETRPVVIEGSEGEVRIEAEIADSDSERARGLMAREELGANEGMLFVFEDEQELGFYMKNTLIPLSVAYIDSGGRIVDIQEMQPLDETSHPSAEPAQYALEVNQGFFEEHGVEVGHRVELPR